MAEIDPEVAPMIQALIEIRLGWMVPEILQGIDEMRPNLTVDSWVFDVEPYFRDPLMSIGNDQKAWVADFVYSRVKETVDFSRESLKQLNSLRIASQDIISRTKVKPLVHVLQTDDRQYKLSLEELEASEKHLILLRETLHTWIGRN